MRVDQGERTARAASALYVSARIWIGAAVWLGLVAFTRPSPLEAAWGEALLLFAPIKPVRLDPRPAPPPPG